MKTTAIETLFVDCYLFIQVHTEAGISDLGESLACGSRAMARCRSPRCWVCLRVCYGFGVVAAGAVRCCCIHRAT